MTMQDTPACVLNVSGGEGYAQYRNVSPVFQRGTWGDMLAGARSIIRAFQIPKFFLMLTHGLDYGLYANGQWTAQGRQTFDAYNDAIQRPGTYQNVMDNDALQAELEGILQDGCETIVYIGPNCKSQTPDLTRMNRMKEPYGGLVSRYVLDGGGARNDAWWDGMIEPLAQRRTQDGHDMPESMKARGSYTNSNTYRGKEQYFWPLDQYTGERWWCWVEGGRTHRDQMYWPDHEDAVSKGFKLVLPTILEVWEVWHARYAGGVAGNAVGNEGEAA